MDSVVSHQESSLLKDVGRNLDTLMPKAVLSDLLHQKWCILFTTPKVTTLLTSVPKNDLGEQCSPRDESPCLDEQAECRSGICQCTGEYYESNGKCSE